jgi:hypothetical protein
VDGIFSAIYGQFVSSCDGLLLSGSGVMLIEEQLRERLKKVEALYFGATTAG